MFTYSVCVLFIKNLFCTSIVLCHGCPCTMYLQILRMTGSNVKSLERSNVKGGENLWKGITIIYWTRRAIKICYHIEAWREKREKYGGLFFEEFNLISYIWSIVFKIGRTFVDYFINHILSVWLRRIHYQND